MYSVALVTIRWASTGLRPWSMAIDRIWARESLITLRRRSQPMFWPEESIGAAAPMWVVGAITARSDAMVITAPAEAARAPAGVT